MRFKKNDTVKIIQGKDRGKTGKIIEVYRDGDSGKIIVQGINIYKKHTKPKKQGQKGEVISVPKWIFSSKAMIFCSNCNKGTRIGIKLDGNQKIRLCKTCKKTL